MPKSKELQLGLPFRQWGGRRNGAGRKPNGPRAGVSHLGRPSLAARFPVHVTLRLRDGIPSLRTGRMHAALRRCLAEANARASRTGRGRVVHYSIMPNHLHLLWEARNREALSRGVQGLATRLARAVNRVAERSGRVFGDRYHARILKTPREVRHALAYVLSNARRHGLVRGRTSTMWVDPYSSGAVFDGWRTKVTGPAFHLPAAKARTWLLSVGWRRHGLLDPAVAPGRSS
jgi:REP element-mobilizing transposase RayT